MASRTVLKWRNSLAFRLPAAIARQPEFTQDDLRKALRKTRKQVVKWGPPRGNEVW